MGLVWREQLSVGNDVIDNDHRYLIDIINHVEQSLGSKSHRELSAALDRLSKYSQEHFAREEKIARAAGYEQVPDLSHSHEALIKQLDQIKTEIREMGNEWLPEVADNFTQLLRSWLIDHVIKEDLLMKPVLQKHSPLFDPW
jgi:hemerythrin